MASKPYNGHPSWTLWNVSLWIGNDEGLYTFARECIRRERNKDVAASIMLAELPEKTPDGARYTFTSVRYALRGL